MRTIASRVGRARIVRFAGVSGTGLAIDYALLTLLCEAGVAAGWANVASAAAAVSFVFVVSARHIFESPRGFLLVPFAWYAAYQAIAIALASAAVGGLTAALDGSYLIAKSLVVPVSFTANYVFISWLLSSWTERRESHGI